MSYLPQQLFRR